MPKCQLEICSTKCAIIIGYCSYCKNNFCGQHRLPEDHMCENMEDCKKKKFNLNAKKVMSEKCVSKKL